MNSSMHEVALLIQTLDAELRQALKHSRSGIFRNVEGNLIIRSNVPLGKRYTEEVIGIFADTVDLDFFYKIYLKEDI
ncbi:MAG: hypothetical protein HQ508_09045 [Candidatus Marinimicrobia bacterium]|nr:hypothetical protein [Candidatus Neomarinimicrobiota bacterium]